MDTTMHIITTLFKQLGLPNSETEIDTFVAQNSLPATTLLQDAPF